MFICVVVVVVLCFAGRIKIKKIRCSLKTQIPYILDSLFKLKMSSFKSKENVSKKEHGPYHSFDL